MDVSITQLGAAVNSAGPSSTVTQPRTFGIQPCAVVRLGLGMGEGVLGLGWELGARLVLRLQGFGVGGTG